MFFNLFSAHPSAHLKRAVLMLHEAQMARLEHEAAAEHHGALARMYAERVQRLEAEVFRPQRVEAEDKVAEPIGAEKQAPLYSLDGNRRASLPSAA
ncbi:MAG TPA: hypothetical protein VMR43_01980 [Variovorax sp.]|jgi:hypothetical protein|nr:hypothetical protein [Variovorax sp.]